MPRIYKRNVLIDIFKSVKPKDECLIFTGPVHEHGYGLFNLDGRQRRAHRMAYLAVHGSIPEGKLILHKCHVRRCINLNHLYAGTSRENRWDAIRRFGKATNAKLTPEAVRNIRTYVKHGGMAIEMSQKYKVSKSVIHDVVYRKNWVWVS